MRRRKRDEDSKGVHPPAFGVSPGTDCAVQLRLSRGALLLTLAVWLLPVGATLGLFLSQQREGAADQARASKAREASVTRAGPWGELEVTPLKLEPPPEYIASAGLVPRPVRWVLHQVSRETAEGWFLKAGLDRDQVEQLKSARWEELPEGVAVYPPEDLVLRLSPTVRERLYGALGRFPANRYQREPARFPGKSEAEWFEGAGLSPETFERVASLVYRRQETLLFSDLDLALARIASVQEREAFIQTLARERSVMVRLRVPHAANVRDLADYWALPGRTRDVLPLLEALADQPEGGIVNVALLLPPFARSYLYTFARTPLDPTKAPDCFATCLYFQKDMTREPVSWGPLPFREILERDYFQPSGDPRLGDLFLLGAEGADPVHCATYVAADIVFTKNGASVLHPWMFMRAGDVAAMFSSEKPLGWRVMRKRDP